MRHRINTRSRREYMLWGGVILLCGLLLLGGIFANQAKHLSGLPQRLLGIPVYKNLGDREGSGEGVAMQWLASTLRTSGANEFIVEFHDITSKEDEDYVYNRQAATLTHRWYYGTYNNYNGLDYLAYSPVSDAKVYAVAKRNGHAADLLSYGCTKRRKDPGSNG